jgi:hypothetical protein
LPYREGMAAEPNPQDAAAIARAFQMAAHLPTREKLRLRAIVLNSEGSVLAAGTLLGHRQAALFRDQLQILGSFVDRSDTLAAAHGCELLLQQQPDEAHPRRALTPLRAKAPLRRAVR